MRSSLTLRSLLCTIAALIASHTAAVFAQEAEAEAESAQQSETLVYAARGVPVAELADVIQQLTRKGEVTVVPEVITNHLVLSGPPDLVRRLSTVLEQIDRLPRRIEIQALLVELRDLEVEVADGEFEDHARSLRDLAANGGATILTRVRMTTLDNQLAQVQVGGQKAVLTGGVFSPRDGRRSNTYQVDEEGLIVAVTPRATDESIMLNISVEETRIEDSPAPSADSVEDITPPAKSTAVVNSTVSVKDGETVTISDVDQGRGDSNRRVIVVVTARVLDR